MLQFRLPRKCPPRRVGATSQKSPKVAKSSPLPSIVPGKNGSNSEMIYRAVVDILRTINRRKLWVNILVKMVGERLQSKIVVGRQAVLKALHRLKSCHCVRLTSEQFVRVTDNLFASDIEAWKNRFLGVPTHA